MFVRYCVFEVELGFGSFEIRKFLFCRAIFRARKKDMWGIVRQKAGAAASSILVRFHALK